MGVGRFWRVPITAVLVLAFVGVTGAVATAVESDSCSSLPDHPAVQAVCALEDPAHQVEEQVHQATPEAGCYVKDANGEGCITDVIGLPAVDAALGVEVPLVPASGPVIRSGELLSEDRSHGRWWCTLYWGVPQVNRTLDEWYARAEQECGGNYSEQYACIELWRETSNGSARYAAISANCDETRGRQTVSRVLTRKAPICPRSGHVRMKARSYSFLTTIGGQTYASSPVWSGIYYVDCP